MKKWITAVTTASLLLGSVTVPAYGATFADIDTVTWSGFKTFLTQAADLGLMKGYDENGKKYCKPRNNVTYCEAAQLMYSIMKVYTKQDVSDTAVTKWTPVMKGYNIPTWAYKAIAYALEEGILSADDLADYQNGTKAANREDVGVIFGAALNTIDGYSTKSNASLSYLDKAKVSSNAVRFLELLYRENLMVGDSDNYFKPQNNITRAEMAVLSVKMYNKLSEQKPTQTTQTTDTVTASVISAMLMSNGDLFLSLQTSGGTGLNLFAEKDKVTPEYDGDEITLSDIKAGDTVKVKYKGQDIQTLEVTYSKYGIQKAETYELEDLTDSKITVLDEDGEELTYRLLNGVSVTLEGKTSTISKLQKAMEDMKYDVTLTLNEDERVTKIKAVMNENNPTEGYLTDVEDDSITIKAGSKEYTYPLAEGSISIKQDGKTMTFSKLKKNYDDYNYTVSLKLNKDNEVTAITIEDLEDETKGTLTALTSRRITITAAGEEYTYSIDADDVIVKIDGKKSTLEKLKEAFKEDDELFTVELEDIDRDDYVGTILATTKASKEGELVKLTKKQIEVEVDGKDITYTLASDIEVRINEKKRSVEELMEDMDTYDFTVKLEFDSADKVSKITADLQNPKEGYLKDIVEDKETITVTVGSVDVKLTLASNAEITLDGKSTTLKKLNSELDYASSKEQISVELTYNKSGKVTELEASWEEEKPTSGELYKVSPSDNEIIIRDDGEKYTYSVKKSVDISVSFASSVDTDDYKKASKYTEDLSALKAFLSDCDDNKDDCYVTLTVNSAGTVTKIQAKAK